MKSLVVLTVSILSAVSILFCPIVLAAPPSMPDDVQLGQPDPTLPKELTAFWGQWEGSYNDSGKFGQLIQMWVVVEKITEGKAILHVWRSEYGWSPRREATVTKENGKYKLRFLFDSGKVEMTLKDELLVWNIPNIAFSFNLKRVAEKGADTKADAKAALIDINTATKAELTSLPGVGEAYSQKIIDGRPYVKKDHLKSKKIIPGAVYDKISGMIVAKQAPKKK